MTQYEQKTDSREFEVANPDQNMGPWSGNSPTGAADIAIRLWGPATSDSRVPLTWKAESALVYMIADLVSASRGHIAEESPGVMAAHFDSCRQAVVAAKRIQTSILEFLTCRPGERIGGAILVYQPQTADPTGLSGELVQLELEQAKPGQILLAENVSRRLRDLPGIEFMASPEPGGDGPTGLTELIWTTAQRVALMQESVGDGTESMGVDVPPVGATLIVNTPIVHSPNVDSPFARRGPTNDAAPPTGRTQDSIIKDRPEKDRPEKDRPEKDRPKPGSRRITELTQKAGSSLTEELEIGERPLFSRTRVILGAVAIVLVAALIAVLFRPTQASRPKTAPPQGQTAATTTGSTDQKTPTTDQKTPTGDETGAKPASTEGTTDKSQFHDSGGVLQHQESPKSPDGRVKNKKDKKESKESKENSDEPQPLDEYGGFSQKDIPKLLEFAQADTQKGDYPKARREYSTILKLQPKNQDAKDGLHKLDLIQRDQQ